MKARIAADCYASAFVARLHLPTWFGSVRRDEDERSLDPAQLFTNSSETTVYNARSIEVMW